MAHAVVQFPRDMPPLVVLHSYQPIRKLSKLFRSLQDFSVAFLQLACSYPYLYFQFIRQDPEPLLAFAQSLRRLLLQRDIVVRFQNGPWIPLIVSIQGPTAADHDLAFIFALVNQLASPTTLALDVFGDAFERRRELGAQKLMAHAAERLFASVAVKLGSAFVPVSDSVRGIANQDGVSAQIQEPRLLRQGTLGLLASSNVPSYL